MGCVYKRGGKLWIRYKDPSGKWTQASTDLGLEDEDKAGKMLANVEARISAGIEIAGVGQAGPLLLKQYAEGWIAERQVRGIRSAKDDAARFRRHVYPVLGDLPLADVSQRHMRDYVRGMVAAKTLAPRTIHHVFNLAKTMFSDARVDLLVDVNPCVLKRADLPKKVDKDPMWRGGAVFEREEVERICTSHVIPADRRVLYSILALTGLRFGEASALRWSAYDAGKKPLGLLAIGVSYDSANRKEKSVKSQRPRQVPAHPQLAALLVVWREKGWEKMVGRAPTNDDLIIPTQRNTPRNNSEGWATFQKDLDVVGLRRRRVHDLRRTMITLARNDGARKDVLEWITHGPRGDIVDMYTSLPWPLLCEELAKLDIKLGAMEGDAGAPRGDGAALADTSVAAAPTALHERSVAARADRASPEDAATMPAPGVAASHSRAAEDVPRQSALGRSQSAAAARLRVVCSNSEEGEDERSEYAVNIAEQARIGNEAQRFAGAPALNRNASMLHPVLQGMAKTTQVFDISQDKMVTPTGIEPVFSA